jgi:CheY-like chemotaxis protein
MAEHRMLIVEGEPSARHLMARIFSRRGWDVAAVGTVADGLAALGAGPAPDCLVLDLMLPDGDGEDVLRLARSDGLTTRVVVATVCGEARRLRTLAALGPDRVLTKPLDCDDICRSCGGRPDAPDGHGNQASASGQNNSSRVIICPVRSACKPAQSTSGGAPRAEVWRWRIWPISRRKRRSMSLARSAK